MKEQTPSSFGAYISQRPDSPPAYKAPATPWARQVARAMIAGPNVKDLEKYEVTHGEKNTVRTLENAKGDRALQVEHENGGKIVKIRFFNWQTLSRYNNSTLKLILFVLSRIQQTAYANGGLYKDVIEIPTRAPMDIGWVQNLTNSRRIFRELAPNLLSVCTEDQNGRFVSLFTEVDTSIRGVVTIYLNPRAQWDQILQNYTYLPPYTFSLLENAFNLQVYLCDRARQNGKSLRENGYFFIKIQTVAEHMALPIDRAKDVRQKILKPLFDAADEITQHDIYTVSPEYGADWPPSRILREGRLRVSISPDYRADFTGLPGRSKGKKKKKTPPTTE